MPLIGSSAYGTMGQLTNLIRSLLLDTPGNVYTDTYLLQSVNSAYRTVQRKVANAGGDEFITDNILLTVPLVAVPDPGTQVMISDATAPPNQLPSNLLVPLKIWERKSLSQDDFVEMVNLTQHGGLPSRLQGMFLDVWEWRTDGIYFIGATQNIQIRLRYQAAFQDLTGPNDVILIRGAQEAIAFLVAAEQGMAHENPLSEKWDQAGIDAIEDLILQNVRVNQVSPTRRRAYGARSGLRRGGRPWDSP